MENLSLSEIDSDTLSDDSRSTCSQNSQTPLKTFVAQKLIEKLMETSNLETGVSYAEEALEHYKSKSN